MFIRGSEYFYSSRAIDMDGRGSPLITADKLNSLDVCGCVAPLETQLGMFNCVDNCIILVVYIRHQVLWGPKMTSLLYSESHFTVFVYSHVLVLPLHDVEELHLLYR